MAEINEKLSKLLKEVGEVVDVRDKNSAVWSLPQNKNALIVKHKALEKISAHLGMWFDPPKIIESDTEKKIVSLVVQGYIDDGKEKEYCMVYLERLVLKIHLTSMYMLWQKRGQ